MKERIVFKTVEVHLLVVLYQEFKQKFLFLNLYKNSLQNFTKKNISTKMNKLYLQLIRI
jgi:hypothetical protein